jgi:hypothetical protein
MKFICNIASLVSMFMFVGCTAISLLTAINLDFGASIGYGLLAGVHFVLMVIFGYISIKA